MIAQSRQSRRTFLIGSAAAAAAASTKSPASAQGGAARALDIVYRSISVRGRAARIYGLVDEKGRPGSLTFEEGGTFAVRLANKTKEPTLVHWHGMTPPWRQDGVPDVTQPMLQPGASYEYSYPLTRPGTNWMHAHTLQEAQLLAAPLIVRERAADRIDEQEVVVMLHDFSFKSPDEILAGLRGARGGGRLGERQRLWIRQQLGREPWGYEPWGCGPRARAASCQRHRVRCLPRQRPRAR